MATHPDPAILLCGELASLSGLSTDTLRHYERKGLLCSQRLANGYRSYSPEALNRVRMIQRALSVGFSLGELARFLSVRDEGGTPCRNVRALAAAKLQQIDDQLNSLSQIRETLKGVLETWDDRLAETKKGDQARLLDFLADGPPRKTPPARRTPW